MKEGYKMSELGLVPNDWKVVKLGKYGSFSKGKGLSKKELSNHGLPCIRYGEIYTKHHYIIKNFYSFIEPILAKSSIKIKKNDLLFAGSGETAKDIGKAVAYLGNEDVYAGGDIIIFSPTGFNSAFLSYCLNSNFIIKQRRKFGQGNSVVHIYARDLSVLDIPKPSIKEQQKIAKILSTVDNKIAVLDEQLLETQALKKGLMQRLLTKGIGHTVFKESVLGEIPVGWEVEQLGKIAEIIMGQSPLGDSYNRLGNGVPVLNGPTEFTETSPIPVQYTIKATKLCKKKDVLFCVRGSTTGRMNIANQVYCIGRGLAAIRGTSKSITLFVFYILQNLAKEVLRKAKDMGSTFPNVNSKELNSYLLRLPPIKEQQKIAKILTTVDDKLQVLKDKKVEYQSLKKGLMQQLLTGKIRVKLDT